VMPSSFNNVTEPDAELWAPLQYDATLAGGFNSREWGHHLKMIARLRAGASLDAARTELNTIAQQPLKEFARPPWASLSGGLQLMSLQERLTSAARPVLLAVLAAVLLLLVIATINLMNLMLANAAQRSGEFAVRGALGAGPWRVARQLVTESMTIAAIGCMVGDAMASAGIRALVALSPEELPRREAIRLDGTALLFSIAVTVLVMVAASAAPVAQAFRQSLWTTLTRASRNIARGRGRLRWVLIVLEFALATMLLVASGLLVRSVQRLFANEAGFDASHVITMQVLDAAARPPERAGDEARVRYYDEALRAVVEWHAAHRDGGDMRAVTVEQIRAFAGGALSGG